jgi:hypothetical protein
LRLQETWFGGADEDQGKCKLELDNLKVKGITRLRGTLNQRIQNPARSKARKKIWRGKKGGRVAGWGLMYMEPAEYLVV